ncbi:DUF2789 domain-containing protein [Alkalimarinus coralli]|uniref:DUF2789 domain-containing protein n=1 Tax=Alkalimarinus coralli TaxID=2935863 RepID=UPI00202AD003|nr:DUF2789 domain-containing protein [Alkalimarinus coralli]
MDTSFHSMNNLFAQLGLPDDDASIESFIRQHRFSDNSIRLNEASFWNEAQARFLCEAIQEDSDWAETVDQLNAQLRH